MVVQDYAIESVPEDQHLMQNLVATFFFVAYVFLIVVAICGSGTIIFLVLRYRNLRCRPINFYYANMAFADLFVASLGAPFRALYYLDMRWTLGPFLCHWFEYAENLGYFVHIYSLTVASFLILQDVSHVRRSYRRHEDPTRSTCLQSYVVSSFGVWTFGILACLPYATFRHYVREQCPLSAHNFFLLPEKLFGPLVIIVVPVSIAILCILMIICCACSTSRRVVTTYQEHVLLRTQKSTRHVSLLMLIYILCQIPYFALKWLRGLATHDTLQICASGLRLACVCFSAAFFCYISEEKVLYNVRHAIASGKETNPSKPGKSSKPVPDKIPLRSVSDTQYRSPDGELQRDGPGGRHIPADPSGQPPSPINYYSNSPQRNGRADSRATLQNKSRRGPGGRQDECAVPLRRETPETYV